MTPPNVWDYSDLEAKARAAEPKWGTLWYSVDYEQGRVREEYFHAANPATLLHLIEENKRLKQERDHLLDAVGRMPYLPGTMITRLQQAEARAERLEKALREAINLYPSLDDHPYVRAALEETK